MCTSRDCHVMYTYQHIVGKCSTFERDGKCSFPCTVLFFDHLQYTTIQSRTAPLPPSVCLGRHWRHSHDKMDQAFPPQFMHTASDQKLDGGKAWEWGYRMWGVALFWLSCESNTCCVSPVHHKQWASACRAYPGHLSWVRGYIKLHSRIICGPVGKVTSGSSSNSELVETMVSL